MKKRVLFSAVATTGVLALIELLAWAGEWVSWSTDAQRWTDGAGLYQADVAGRPRLRPGARLEGWRHDIQVNAHGFRGPELLEEADQDVLRIWCAGGSTTFDIYASSDAATWPSVMKEQLAQRLPDRQIDVLNAGVPSYTLKDSLNDWRERAPELLPEVLVVYHGMNDLRVAAQVGVEPSGSDAKAGSEPMSSPFQVLACYRAAQRVVGGLIDRPGWAEHRFAEDQWASIEADLHALIDLGVGAQAQVVLATQPYQVPAGARGLAARWRVRNETQLWSQDLAGVLDSISGYNALVTEVAAAEGLVLVDLAAQVPTSGRYWGDASHFSDAGSARAGAAMADGVADAVRKLPEVR